MGPIRHHFHSTLSSPTSPNSSQPHLFSLLSASSFCSLAPAAIPIPRVSAGGSLSAWPATSVGRSARSPSPWLAWLAGRPQARFVTTTADSSPPLPLGPPWTQFHERRPLGIFAERGAGYPEPGCEVVKILSLLCVLVFFS